MQWRRARGRRKRGRDQRQAARTSNAAPTPCRRGRDHSRGRESPPTRRRQVRPGAKDLPPSHISHAPRQQQRGSVSAYNSTPPALRERGSERGLHAAGHVTTVTSMNARLDPIVAPSTQRPALRPLRSSAERDYVATTVTSLPSADLPFAQPVPPVTLRRAVESWGSCRRPDSCAGARAGPTLRHAAGIRAGDWAPNRASESRKTSWSYGSVERRSRLDAPRERPRGRSPASYRADRVCVRREHGRCSTRGLSFFPTAPSPTMGGSSSRHPPARRLAYLPAARHEAAARLRVYSGVRPPVRIEGLRSATGSTPLRRRRQPVRLRCQGQPPYLVARFGYALPQGARA